MYSNVSIIVPTYNEQDNILNLVERIDRTMQLNQITYEIIFIDDNSTDLTRETISLLVNSYPVTLFKKEGKRGKAYSILEGVTKAKYENICMIDADLQYPPEAISEMLSQIDTHGVVVANRKEYNDSFLRGLLHNGFSFVFGTLLHGFNFDVQSGLKLFKKEIAEHINYNKVSPWTIDLTILTNAKNMGYTIGTVDISFDERKFGFDVGNTLFSTFALDHGTDVLLRSLIVNNPKSILDLGCGYGPIGIVLAKTNPQAQVTLLDKDLLAIRYAKTNIEKNNVTNANTLGSVGMENIEEQTFDLIVSNIPAKIGDEAIAEEFILKPIKHLTAEGELWVVVVNALNRLIPKVARQHKLHLKEIKKRNGHTVYKIKKAGVAPD